jgi:hypothetical protein
MSRESSPRRVFAAAASVVFPGLGHLLSGAVATGAGLFATALALIAACWQIERFGGTGAGILAFLLIVLPWWLLQAYAVAFAVASGPIGLRDAGRLVWRRADDVRFLGLLFFISGALDLWIILANPTYSLAFFCTKPTGVAGVLTKVQSPTFHLFIGYGFLRLRRWSLFVYYVYATFGLLNAMTNFACFGYGRVRSIFLLTLIGFTAYVFLRRKRFSE